MANKYLNKNVRFKCQSGNAVWFKAENGDTKVKIKNTEVLVDDCKLRIIGGMRPGQCNLLKDPNTGIPLPCSADPVIGIWNNTSRLMVGSKSVLTSRCYINCPLFGCIKPFKPTMITIDVGDDTKIQSIDLSLDNNSDTYNDNYEKKADNDQNKSDTKKFDDGVIEKNIESKLCDYENCTRRAECEFLKTLSTIKETNESKNANELKGNMLKYGIDKYIEEDIAIAPSFYKYNSNAPSSDQDNKNINASSPVQYKMYSIAHHHIVPVNQCFKTFEEIVKLANYYNYNINRAENGICLPTMNEGYDKNIFNLKKEVAFYAMEKIGKQWHKGGHKYSCDKIREDVDKVLQKPFINYQQAVCDELRKFTNKLLETPKCRADNYEEQAIEFEIAMNHICERIEKKLQKFKETPKKSYPYYVSKLAFYFAFEEGLKEYENQLFEDQLSKDEGV
jgi:hypothetical protein